MLLREGLELATALGERLHTVEGLEVTLPSQRVRATRQGGELIGAADADRERTRDRRKSDEVRFLEEMIREIERSLGREEFLRALERGRRLALEAAVAVAIAATERERHMT